MKTLFAVIMILIMILAISGCAAGPNEFVNIPDEEGKVAGFWQGLWHGFVSPFTFLISLFSDTVHVYEIHNNGGWYNFGFLFGHRFSSEEVGEELQDVDVSTMNTA